MTIDVMVLKHEMDLHSEKSLQTFADGMVKAINDGWTLTCQTNISTLEGNVILTTFQRKRK